MICPYCGKEIESPTREHFFPQSVYSNSFDFIACRACNRIKQAHIVYPTPNLFKKYPEGNLVEKWKNLWKLSQWDKYLNIYPARDMRESLDCGRLVQNTFAFSIEERLFYELDKLKEMYVMYAKLLYDVPYITAVVVCPDLRKIYILHTMPYEFSTPYKCVQSMHVERWVRMQVKGWLILGSSEYYVWRYTENRKEYFASLLRAPSTRDILSDKWGVLRC